MDVHAFLVFFGDSRRFTTCWWWCIWARVTSSLRWSSARPLTLSVTNESVVVDARRRAHGASDSHSLLKFMVSDMVIWLRLGLRLGTRVSRLELHSEQADEKSHEQQQSESQQALVMVLASRVWQQESE